MPKAYRMRMRWRTPRLSSIPAHVHPLVALLFEEMQNQQIGVLDMAARSGVNKNTLRAWRTKSVPAVSNLDACFTVLGYKLSPVSDKLCILHSKKEHTT
jgi:hypothetical protein